MDLRSTQLKDTYGNLVTTGTTEGSPTSGGLQNGQGTLLTAVGIGTNSPSAKLNVAGALGAVIGGGASAIRMTNTDTSNYASISAGIVGVSNDGMDFSVDGTRSMVIDGSGNVGIGTDTPATNLHVYNGASGGTVPSFTLFVVENNTNAYIQLLSPSANEQAIRFGDADDSDVGSIDYLHASNQMLFTVNAQEAMRIDSRGNLLIGTTARPTSSEGNIVLKNGTAPTGNATDGIILYAEDVSTSSELKVRDEAGNVTTLSPHNFSLIPDGASEEMAWAYYSERDGKKINVDMLKLARMVESLTGEKLVYEQ